MGGSLQDQLLKSGLVTEEQLHDARERPKRAEQARKGPRPERARRGGGKGRSKRGAGGPRKGGDGRSQAPQRAMRDTASEAKAAEEAAERALRKRVHQMIADSTEARDEGETPYHFVKGSRVKRIYVTEPQRDRLADGDLAVAAMKGKHYLIPMTIAREIRGLIPAYFVAMGESHRLTGDSPEVDDARVGDAEVEDAKVDDEYADFQVPDDLTW